LLHLGVTLLLGTRSKASWSNTGPDGSLVVCGVLDSFLLTISTRSRGRYHLILRLDLGARSCRIDCIVRLLNPPPLEPFVQYGNGCANAPAYQAQAFQLKSDNFPSTTNRLFSAERITSRLGQKAELWTRLGINRQPGNPASSYREIN
jgi:hypothetical protein